LASAPLALSGLTQSVRHTAIGQGRLVDAPGHEVTEALGAGGAAEGSLQNRSFAIGAGFEDDAKLGMQRHEEFGLCLPLYNPNAVVAHFRPQHLCYVGGSLAGKDKQGERNALFAADRPGLLVRRDLFVRPSVELALCELLDADSGSSVRHLIDARGAYVAYD
jgi:hypothetical protein